MDQSRLTTWPEQQVYSPYVPVFHVLRYGPDEVFARGPATATGPRLHGQDDREAHLGLRDGARDVGVLVHAENLFVVWRCLIHIANVCAAGQSGGRGVYSYSIQIPCRFLNVPPDAYAEEAGNSR